MSALTARFSCRRFVTDMRPIGVPVDFTLTVGAAEREVDVTLLVDFKWIRYIPATHWQPAEGGHCEIRTIWIERVIRGVKSWRYLGCELDGADQERLQRLIEVEREA